MQQSYIDRMESALNHKRYFIDIIKELSKLSDEEFRLHHLFSNAKATTVLDFGCGSGMLAHAIAQALPNAEVVGYDQSAEMVAIAKKKYNNLSNLTFVDKEPSADKQFRFVVLSSVLHEVFSTEKDHIAVPDFLNTIARKYLKKGGYIISRDNICYDNQKYAEPQAHIYEEYTDKVKEMLTHLKNGPFGALYDVRIDDAGDVYGKESAVRELLNKFTWGWQSFPRESQEFLHFATPRAVSDWRMPDLTLKYQLAYPDGDYLRYLSAFSRWYMDRSTHQWTVWQSNT